MTQEFSLGIIAAVGIAFVVTTVVMMFRYHRAINALRSYANDLETRQRESDRSIWDRVHKFSEQLDLHDMHTNRTMENTVTDIYRHIDEVSRGYSDSLMRHDHQMEMYMRGVNDQITDAVTQCRSYTDSRIDKLIAKFPVTSIPVGNAEDLFTTKNYM